MPKKAKAKPAASPVVVTVQPVTRCAQPGCGYPVSYPREPGAAGAALTTHWNREHAGR
jgi:hypothetical protein